MKNKSMKVLSVIVLILGHLNTSSAQTVPPSAFSPGPDGLLPNNGAPFLVVISPGILVLEGETVTGTQCYSVAQTIYVSLNPEWFTVVSGGIATFIAGQNIRFLPGTTVMPGGKLHGYITTTNDLCCGQPKTINHVAGAIAPVSKSVTYGTINNIPGEVTKCWITSNLGADHQATAVNDATEASAGWYWQFNRKQGYKHDGTTRTPNNPWIATIIENADWQAANDPCTIELSTLWRIPTYTEWYNVLNTGGWTTWAGPWGSGLKMHAAGYLANRNGSLGNRGSYGYYFSSTQYSAPWSYNLTFGSEAIYMNISDKAYGFSVRCVRDY